MPCSASDKSFNSFEHAISIMAKRGKKRIPGQGWELLDRGCRETVPLLKFMEAAKMSHSYIEKKNLLLVKQDWFSQTCQDLWYMYWDYFSNHLRKADLGRQRLSLDKKVKCKLMELLYSLKQKKHTNKQRHWTWHTKIYCTPKLCFP